MAPSFISKKNNGLVARGLEAPALAVGLTLTVLACVYMCVCVCVFEPNKTSNFVLLFLLNIRGWDHLDPRGLNT